MGITPFFALKRRRRSAVFLPTPGRAISSSLASSNPFSRTPRRSPAYFSRTNWATSLILAALSRNIPAGLIAEAISSTSASARLQGSTPTSLSSLSKALRSFL
ncbi:hypothetical protein DRO56_03805 [Candidatus Bathyarchaeota archaeon]|nr:MAG: hypothetical protein DRO56_03805 [Candidatus Bathyarchaeota archaeon]